MDWSGENGTSDVPVTTIDVCSGSPDGLRDASDRSLLRDRPPNAELPKDVGTELQGAAKGRDYSKVKCFSCGQMGHTDAVEHEIDTGHSAPIRCAPRRMSPHKMKKEEECVTDMLTSGQIEASDSPWSSPVILVTKNDGGNRICVDYRRLNDVTVRDACPLPRIDDTLDMLAGKQ